jgi:hypothetical protein
MDMDFQTRFLITRWAIRAFGLVIMGSVFPFLVVMTFRTWRALWRFLRTERNTSAPVVVDIVMPLIGIWTHPSRPLPASDYLIHLIHIRPSHMSSAPDWRRLHRRHCRRHGDKA